MGPDFSCFTKFKRDHFSKKFNVRTGNEAFRGRNGSDFGFKGNFFQLVSKGISSDELYAEVERGTIRRGSFFAGLPVSTRSLPVYLCVRTGSFPFRARGTIRKRFFPCEPVRIVPLALSHVYY